MILAAGPLTLLFQPESAAVRSVRVGAIEVLRGIYAVVRDANWGTVHTLIEHLQVDREPDRFQVSFSAHCQRGPIDFRWDGVLTGEPEGVLAYTVEGEALATFLRNRIGFCVLHPIRQCAGRPCTVVRTDGSTEHGEFPDAISPHQPFRDIRSISHEPTPGLRATVKLAGDVFEMEDQRNWSDASYKTYCTPLDLPFPVEVRQGTRIHQKVTLKLQATSATIIRAIQSADDDIVARLGRVVRVPKLGLCAAGHGRRLSTIEAARLRALRLDHLRVDIKLSTPDCFAAFRQCVEEAVAMGASLHVAFHVSDAAESELARFVDELGTIRPPVAAWFLFHRASRVTPLHWLDRCRPLLKSRWPAIPIGAGTIANFAELNRDRLPPGSAEIVCFALNPQVHAFDNLSLVESLESQPQMVACARAFAGASIAVAPITLKPQFNPDATAATAPLLPSELPPEVDPRQCSLFAAGWTLGSVAQLTAAGTEIATYFETTGWLGVMETESGSPLPEKFPSTPGSVFPMYHVLADLAEAAGSTVRFLETDPSRGIQGLLLEARDRRRLLIANPTEEAKVVWLPAELHEGRASWRLRLLDQANLADACSQPDEFRRTAGQSFTSDCIELPPHAYANLETGKEGTIS
ncbi:MAG: hypothetical protein ACLP9L_17885 [Thermoguttaceae bacterium]